MLPRFRYRRIRSSAVAIALALAAHASRADDAPPIAAPGVTSSVARTSNRAQSALSPTERIRAAVGRNLLWFDAQQANTALRALLNQLERADDEGLRATEYEPARIRRALEANKAIPEGPNDLQLDELDKQITMIALRYLRHLHLGRIKPSSAHPDVKLDARDFDAESLLADSLKSGDLSGLSQAAAPVHPMYARLKPALARYRISAAQASALPSLPPLPARGKIEPGDTWQGSDALAAILHHLGDLPVMPTAGARYEGVLVDALQRFQARHGLGVDAVIGRRTYEALQVPLAHRVAQIELAMERFRWLPEIDADTLVAINIPSFRLWALKRRTGAGQDDTSPTAWQTRIVVGKASDGRTPIFVGSMRWIEFNPYWHVPSSISRDEIVPKLRADPAYLNQQSMMILGRDGSRNELATPELIDGILAGSHRIRQNPGQGNSLGRVKFVMPNNMAIYLHDTPSKNLFRRSRRDFSHGCIRVEGPEKLAEFLLTDTGNWPADRIASAISSNERTIAGLRRPVPVVIFYVTATAQANGEIRFLPDVYDYDEPAMQALSAARGATSN